MVPEALVLALGSLVLNMPGDVDWGTHAALWNACFFCSLSESGVESIECQLTGDKGGKCAKQRDENKRPHDECRGL